MFSVLVLKIATLPKGGKRHEVPCHHNLATYLDAWINAAGIAAEKKGPLFRAIRKGNKLTEAADLLRGGVDHSEFRGYVFALLFWGTES